MTTKTCDECGEKWDDETYDVCPYRQFHMRAIENQQVADSLKPSPDVLSPSQIKAIIQASRPCYYCGRRDGTHVGLCQPDAKIQERR